MTDACLCPECRHPLTLTGVPVPSGGFPIEYGGAWRYEWYVRCERCCKGWPALLAEALSKVRLAHASTTPPETEKGPTLV